MKKLLTLITGASLADIQKRMNTVQHRKAMYNCVINGPEQTTKTRPPVIPDGWSERPTDKQFNDWSTYITSIRVR
jgi:hypothetical protein